MRALASTLGVPVLRTCGKLEFGLQQNRPSHGGFGACKLKQKQILRCFGTCRCLKLRHARKYRSIKRGCKGARGGGGRPRLGGRGDSACCVATVPGTSSFPWRTESRSASASNGHKQQSRMSAVMRRRLLPAFRVGFLLLAVFTTPTTCWGSRWVLGGTAEKGCFWSSPAHGVRGMPMHMQAPSFARVQPLCRS